MGSALKRGRTLDPGMVAIANHLRFTRITKLKRQLKDGSITMKERRELKWKWGFGL